MCDTCDMVDDIEAREVPVPLGTIYHINGFDIILVRPFLEIVFNGSPHIAVGTCYKDSFHC